MGELSNTQYVTLKHVLKLNEETIRLFESLELSDEVRSFIIFDMMVSSYEKTRK